MKATMKLLTMSILTLMYLLVMGLSSTVYATSHYDPDVWKNEGIYTPLTPFESYDWSEETYADFADQFANWSTNMDQSYYPIMDAEEIRQENEVNNTDIQIEDHTFRGFHFEEIVKNAFVDGYKVGFTYQNRDYRSDFDTNRYDIFAMYGSNMPDQKHLYIFSVNVDTEEPVVFYLDGNMMVEGEQFEIEETANEELKAIFYTLLTGEPNSSTSATEVSSNNMTDGEAFSQLSKEEQEQYCMITPWYDVPDGICGNKGIVPDAHYEAAQAFARKHNMDNISYAYEVTYDPIYYDGTQFEDYKPNYDPNTNYQLYLKDPTAYTEIGGFKVPITINNSDLNGDFILSDEELEIARDRHTY